MQDARSAPRRHALVALPAVAALLCLYAPAARAAPSPDGWWMKSNGSAAILIAPCGAALCGRVEWLRAPLDAQGWPKTDTHNPDPALRARLLCGLPMMGAMVPDGEGGWHDGWVYDPTVGKTYKAQMHVSPDGKLHLRGYIGLPLFGRTAVMTRPAAPPTPCAPPG